MAGTLRITRQQLAKFLGNDHDAIRQFETLFSTVADSGSPPVAVEPEIVVEVAAHEALARIERLERALKVEPEIVVEVAGHEALARIERLERAFQMLELAPSTESKEDRLGNPSIDGSMLSSGSVIQSKIAYGAFVTAKNGGTTRPTTYALTTSCASLVITPTTIGNKIRIRGCYNGQKTSTGNICMGLFVGTSIIRQTETTNSSNYAHSGSTVGEYVTTSLNPLTIDLRCNGNNGEAAISYATLEVEEILS